MSGKEESGPVITGLTEDARLLNSTNRSDQSERRFQNTLLSVCSFIITAEFAERLAFYASADTQAAIWNGFCYLSPLLGGWAADAKWGRYKSIWIFIGIYMFGLLLVAFSAQSAMRSPALFFPALYIVALGTGGIKPNVSTFGADQFDDNDPIDKKQKASFFNWFYLSINVGAFASYTLVAYLCQSVSFSLGYSVPAVAMAIAIVIFFSGRSRYKVLPPSGSVLGRFVGMIWEAVWSNRARRPQTSHWLDCASKRYGGSYEDSDLNDAKAVTRLFPFLMLLVIYWCVYSQMSTTFFNMGCQMDLHIGSFEIPVAALGLFNTTIIILLIPLVDRVIFPAFKRCGKELTMLKKIGCGYFFAMLAMTVAGLAETARLQQYNSGHIAGTSICTKNNPPQTVQMSILWQIPQFGLIGASEVLAAVTSLEFFYTQAPDSMKSVCAALNLVTTAFGTWLMAIFVPAVNADKNNEWIAHDLNVGHLNWFFFLLAAMMFVNFVAFVFVAKGYTYRQPEPTADLKSVASVAETEPKDGEQKGEHADHTNGNGEGNVDRARARTMSESA